MDLPRYDRIAAGFHWLTAVLVIALIVLGLGAEPMKAWVDEFAVLTAHKSLGMTVFALTLARLAWRTGHRPPPLPDATPAWQRNLAHGVHWAFYGFMLAMPVLGYVLSSGGPYPLNWFGLFGIPKAPVSKALADAAHAAHDTGGFAMAALVAVHIGAALWHQFFQRDRLLARMRIGRPAPAPRQFTSAEP